MFVRLSRIIKYGFQSFLRNGWLSVTTIGIMVLALVVFEGLILFNFIGKGAVQSIQDKVDISVYFKSNAPEDSILNIKRTLEGLDEVKAVEYVSKDQALEEFKKRHEGEEIVTQTLEELDQNPLLASLNIKAKGLEYYDTIAKYLQGTALKELIEKVTYEQNQVVINRLNALIGILKKLGFVLTVFLAFLAIMVTLTTISLTIFSDREQIGIMRLVGASNSFIQGPYVIEGIIYGVLAAFVSFAVLVPVIHFVSPFILRFVSGVNLDIYYETHFFLLLFYQLIFGVVLSIVSSSIAIRRYLKV